MRILSLILCMLLFTSLSLECRAPNKSTSAYIKSIIGAQKITSLHLTKDKRGKSIENIEVRKAQLLKDLSAHLYLRDNLNFFALEKTLDVSFEKIVIALNKLKTSLVKDTSITIEAKNDHLQSLRELFDSPDVLNNLLPENMNDASLEAICYQPVGTFAHEITIIAQNWLPHTTIDINEPNLSSEGYLFYAIVHEQLKDVLANL